jgi:hypothetical protein
VLRPPGATLGQVEAIAIHATASDHLVTVRSIFASPFADDGDAVYFAGYDANKVPAHNTAWIFRSPKEAALGSPRQQ